MSRLSPFAWLLPAWLLAATPASAADRMELERWEGRAALLPNSGPGMTLFRLRAETHWDESAPRDPLAYAVQVTLPDGSTSTHPLTRPEGPPSPQLSVYVPAAAVQNILPDRVRLRVVVIDANTKVAVSDALEATIEDFPNPGRGRPEDEGRPFGWGRPLDPASAAAPLPKAGPEEVAYIRIAGEGAVAPFFLAMGEATNAQVKARLPEYDPKAGRSDEFALEDPSQPALNLTASKARAYLAALSKADASGVAYRLPSEAEWLRAARAGKSSAFWWGDEAAYPKGANFLGPEPALATDATAPAIPAGNGVRFEPSPWGLFHTFGNVAEWATRGGGFVRLGGHFRTEPAAPLPPVEVAKDDDLGPDPYVGLRPAFSLSAEEGGRLARKALGSGGIGVAFDPLRATVTLTGVVSDSAARRAADRKRTALWCVAAVENRLTVPAPVPGRLATLGAVAGPARRLRPLGRLFDEVPVAVRWADELPVEGSDWFVNIYTPGGGHQAHALRGLRPGQASVPVLVDLALLGQAPSATAALSLGAPAPTANDPHIVSNLATVPVGAGSPPGRATAPVAR